MEPQQDAMSADEYRDSYMSAKQLAFESSTPHQDHPKAIILAGQPGAGKGHLKDQTFTELREQGGAVVIDVDELREFHPRYRQHQNEDYRSAATMVQEASSQMGKDLRRDAIAEQRNIVIDGTFKDPEEAVKLCQTLKDNGYEVEVHAISVDDRTSRRQVAKRLKDGLEEQKAKGNVNPNVRDVPVEIQIKAYKGMPEALQRVEGLVDRTLVVDRYGVVIYESNGTQPVPGLDARAAIEAERSIEWTREEKVDHALAWDDIVAKAKSRAAPDAEMNYYRLERAEAYDCLLRDPQARAEYDRRNQQMHPSYRRHMDNSMDSSLKRREQDGLALEQ